MHQSYEDITSKVPEAPQWWDQHGVPRYAPFAPRLCSVYATQAVLLEIACQYCAMRFQVALDGDVLNPLGNPLTLRYGDPPRHDCVGDSMACDNLRIVEAWTCDLQIGWQRDPAMEGPMPSMPGD